MAIISKTGLLKEKNASENAEKKLISGQTINTADFTVGGNFTGKVDISTSRDVDGGSTGSNWATYFMSSAPGLRGVGAGDTASDMPTIYNSILIDDELAAGEQIEISGYFFRGKTPLEVDLPSGTYLSNANNDADNLSTLDSRIAVLYALEGEGEDYNSFDDFPTASKYQLSVKDDEVLSAHDKWTKFVGKGVVPPFNGSNLGTKGGWFYSKGASDPAVSKCGNNTLRDIQTDASLFSSNFDPPGSGLSRYFRIIIANESGANAQLKIIYDGPDRSNSEHAALSGGQYNFVGIYDLTTKVTEVNSTNSTSLSGLYHEDSSVEMFVNTNKGISNSPAAGNSKLYNLSTSMVDSYGYYSHMVYSIVNGSHTGKMKSTSTTPTIKVHFPFSLDHTSDGGQSIIPLGTYYQNANYTALDVDIGGRNSWGYFPRIGGSGGKTKWNVETVRYKQENSTGTGSVTLRVLYIDWSTTTLSLGDTWTGPVGGGGTQTAINLTPNTSSNTTYKEFTNAGSTHFNGSGESAILILDFSGASSAPGYVVGQVTLVFEFDDLD